MRAESISVGVADLLWGPLRRGVGLGAGYADFGGRVLALTRPGRPRMPNGIECVLPLAAGQPAWVGEGRLEAGGRVVLDGPLWDARPMARIRLAVEPRFTPDPILLAGRGGGLTPSGDDILAGFAAGLVLWHRRDADAAVLAGRAAPRTTRLSATLLWHAALGQLPEPAHRLLEEGDPEPLRAFGHSSGRAILLGLALAC